MTDPQNEQLDDALRVLEIWLELQSDTTRDYSRFRLLWSLCRISRDRNAPGVDLEDVRFTGDDVAKAYHQDHLSRSNEKPGADLVRRYWSGLQKDFPSKEELSRIARKHDLCAIPALHVDRSRGGRGRPSYYWIAPEPASATVLADEGTAGEPPSGGVRYEMYRLSRLPIWSRWMQEFALTGWRRALWLTILIVAVVWLLGVGLIGLVGYAYVDTFGLQELVYFLFALILPVILFITPYSLVIVNRISPAPHYLLPWSVQSGVLQSVRLAEDRHGRAHRQIEIRSYTAECPICARTPGVRGRIEVMGGGLKRWGRVVGRCDENPVEHVFSFDHVTLTGRPIDPR